MQWETYDLRSSRSISSLHHPVSSLCSFCRRPPLNPPPQLTKISPFMVIYSKCTGLFLITIWMGPKAQPTELWEMSPFQLPRYPLPHLTSSYLGSGLTSPCVHQKADFCWVQIPSCFCLFLHTVMMIYTSSHGFTNFPHYIFLCLQNLLTFCSPMP